MSNAPAKRPLNVLELGTHLGVGGITRHILALQGYLQSQGHTVTLGGSPDAWANIDIFPTFLDLPMRYVSTDGGSVPARLGHAARGAWKLRRWLRTHPVDLIHAHESAPALVAGIARLGLNIPLIVTYHGSEPERIAAFGKIARRGDLVITPSHRSAEDLATIGGVPPGKLQVTGLGVTPPPSHSAAEVASLRRLLIGDGDRLIVTIARLTRQKGIDILIDCVVALQKTHPGYRFVVAGDGLEEAALRALAAQKGAVNLHFLGRTTTPHLLLKAADLFLLTSRWEALPFTIPEAFQAGTPVVAAACSGVVELVDDAVGRVVPVGDVAAICVGVAEVLADELRRATMAKAALARAGEDRFDPNWVHPQFEKTYYAVLDQRRRAGRQDTLS